MNTLATLGNVRRHSARFLVRRYYPGIEITGRARIPASGPVLFVATHPNSMLDPALVGLIAARPVHFFAKAPLFDMPALGALMRGFHGRRLFVRMLRQTAWLTASLVPALAGTMLTSSRSG